MDPIVVARFREFEQHGTRAPLYARLATSIANDRELVGLLDAAPAEQRLPVLLFAAVHLLVLEGRAPTLADHYPNVSMRPASGDPFPAFRAVTLDHADEIRSLIAARPTQTNEIGRCALFLPAFAAVERETGPLAHVDVGASAGLNLLLPRYSYDYDGHRIDGDDEAPLLPCSQRGTPPDGVVLPRRAPNVAAAVGIDNAPIDIADDDAVRWLEACVWPDMVDRFERLRAAVALARRHRPTVLPGDAVDTLGEAVDSIRPHGHPIVTTSWVLNYLSDHRRSVFVDRLEAHAREGDLTWVAAESPAETPGLPIATTTPPEVLTVVSIVRWRSGRRTVQRLGTAHPHGYWLHWEQTPAVDLR